VVGWLTAGTGAPNIARAALGVWRPTCSSQRAAGTGNTAGEDVPCGGTASNTLGSTIGVWLTAGGVAGVADIVGALFGDWLTTGAAWLAAGWDVAMVGAITGPGAGLFTGIGSFAAAGGTAGVATEAAGRLTTSGWPWLATSGAATEAAGTAGASLATGAAFGTDSAAPPTSSFGASLAAWLVTVRPAEAIGASLDAWLAAAGAA
jgi:hypothetical protein